jgi:hypothetical protein
MTKIVGSGSRIRIQNQDPDPLVRGVDPRIRIHPKMSWIRNTATKLLNLLYPVVTASDTLRAHRSVLAAHSSFLCLLLTSASGDSAASVFDAEDPVLLFPHYPSLYVRMLLQFFYTGL